MKHETRAARFVDFLERRSALLIAGTIVLTLLLILPMLTMAPTEQASSDPAGEVFDLLGEINERFAAPVHPAVYLIEGRDDDVLTQPVLFELYRNSTALLEADRNGELGPHGPSTEQYLYRLYDIDTNRETVGIVSSVALAVQEALTADPRLNVSLETATTDMVKIALHHIFANPDTEELFESLGNGRASEKRTVLGQEIDYWTAPALIFSVVADNEKLGGGTFTLGVGGGDTVIDKERFNRNVQGLLRGDEETYRLWGLAIDLNLESSDEGQTAGLFIMLTVIAAVLIVGIGLRSYWAMALTGVGLGMLIIWLKGFSALVGLKGGLINDLIVPIAMISLGVDFAVHAVKRYQEEQEIGRLPPIQALRVGLTGVLGALLLAMLSDGIAFLSNLSSGIEGVIHFGAAAAIATVSSFVILGIVVPITLARIDKIRSSGRQPKTLGWRIVHLATKLVSGTGVAALSGVAIIFLVVVWTEVGIAILGGIVVLFLLVPLGAMWWSNRRRPLPTELQPDNVGWDIHFPKLLRVESAIMALARVWPVVLVVTITVTSFSVWKALDLKPTFDVQDFFDTNSDFVVGLDMLDKYIGDRGGEPGLIYIRGDLTDPQALLTIDTFIDRLREVPQIARNENGEVETFSHALSLVRDVTASEFASKVIGRASGIAIMDSNGDGIPDSADQINAIYDYLIQNGLPQDEDTLRYDAGLVKTFLIHDPSGADEDVTVLRLGIVGSRELSQVAAAEDRLTPLLRILEDNPSITKAGLTGSPFTRNAQLSATTRTLRTSVPIAAVGAFILLLVAMRSFRYALVTIIPIGLVVAWLYGFMSMTGFALNFVTATIGAISIGVGVDFSIHMTERFREELGKAPDKYQALRQAAGGTGVALVASAASSIVGFGIMGFAPMPMFASFGQLTAVMIFLALAASLVVLPSLLLLVTRDGSSQPDAETNQ